MHIGHLTIPFEYACGVSRHVWTLAREQQRTDRVTILTSGGGATEELVEDALPWVRLPIHPSAKAPWAFARAVASVAALVRSERITVLHAHHRFHALLARTVRTLLPEIRIVATCHSIVTGARWLSYPVPHIIAVSSATRDHLRRYFRIPLARITVIPNAVPAEPSLPPVLHPAVAGTGGGALILAAGRLSPEKGFDTLIRSLAALRRRSPPPVLVLLGDGPERRALEELAGAAPLKVVFPGAVPSVRPYLERANVVVQPSRSETSSLLALQAGVAGAALVASAVGGVPELVEPGVSGLLVPPDDPASLARAIDAVLDDPALGQRLGRALRQRVLPLSDPAIMAAATRRVYGLHRDP